MSISLKFLFYLNQWRVVVIYWQSELDLAHRHLPTAHLGGHLSFCFYFYFFIYYYFFLLLLLPTVHLGVHLD